MIIKDLNENISGQRRSKAFLEFEAELKKQEKNNLRVAQLRVQDLELQLDKATTEALLSSPDEDIESQALLRGSTRLNESHSYFTQADWQEVTMVVLNDFDQELSLRYGATATNEEKEKCLRYVVANGRYIGDATALLAAYSILKKKGVIGRPAPVAVQPEPLETEVEAEQPALTASEQRAADEKAYIESLREEMFSNPIWRQGMQSLADTSNLEVSFEAQVGLFRFMSPLAMYQPVMNLRNIRKAAIKFWGAATVGLLPEEAASIHESKIFEENLSDDAAKILNLPRRNDYSPRPLAGIRQA